MKKRLGKTTLITGGGSGIGKIMTRLMLERKSKVIIWDISQENIDQTIREFRDKGVVYGYQVDVSSVDQVKATAAKVRERGGAS